jgi:hypothetical protein
MAKKRPLVTVILLLLLVAAGINTVFVYRLYDDTVTAMERKAMITRTGEAIPSSNAAAPAAMSQLSSSAGPDWYGDVSLVRSPQGGYDLTVTAGEARTRFPLAITSFEVHARRLGADEADFTPTFTKVNDSKYVAHIDFPSPGEWEIHARLRRERGTFEFTRRFHVD